MALTPEQREALMLARERIKAGRSYFICAALIEVAALNHHLGNASYELRTFFNAQVETKDGKTLDRWQLAHGIRRTVRQKRRDRLAWIDWLLNEPKEA